MNEILNMVILKHPFHFYKVENRHKSIIHGWFGQDYIREFYYGDGLQNTLNNLELYCQGIRHNGRYAFDHWIAFFDKEPLGFLMTSPVDDSDDELCTWCEKGKKISTLDLLIGNQQFLGQGLAAPMIQAFILDKCQDYDFIIIDPEKANERAIHVYEKVGFSVVGEYSPDYNPVPHVMMRLKVDGLDLQ
ncbi:GNAT family N-acetyltransferase [Legionella geestiana]|uniref:GNAT family N-acetyltransferase n=1 Tax=Legionella geestiana TaxID=45065 RepID=UPI000E0E358F|nr:GNAT family N-acetyltransferase [Legionella geestiana]QBS12896.1 GNAT family N-acetyltransferase [Legionella geestiana]